MAITRRTFLTGTGATRGGLILGGCGGKGSSGKATTTTRRSAATTTSTLPPTTTTTILQAGQRPDPTMAEGTETMPEIQHVVVVMMENHSYDNYFGMLSRGDGFTRGPDGHPTNSNVGNDGVAVRAFHEANTCQGSVSQNWNASHTQWDDGKNDGFVRSNSGAAAMGYWTADDIPFYAGLASTFPVCDRWFASCLAQTYPNRRFLLAGTAQGNISTDFASIEQFQPPNGTIFEMLGRNGIEWRDYYTDLPSIGLFLPVLNKNQDKVLKIDQFYADAASGSLPAFCLVEPNYETNSEENPQDLSRGEAFTAKVINAVMAGPGWAKTLLVWTYDEHGGYYDHVPPPAAVKPDDVPPQLKPNDMPGAYDRYGFRVPAVIVSPYAKKNYVSSVVHDHTSILKFLELKYNLPALTARDGAADGLLDSLDFATPAFATPPKLPASKNSSLDTPLCTAPGPIPNPAG